MCLSKVLASHKERHSTGCFILYGEHTWREKNTAFLVTGSLEKQTNKLPKHPPNTNRYKPLELTWSNVSLGNTNLKCLDTCCLKTDTRILEPPKSHPGFPSRKELAQVFRVHGLLDEEVHLSSHAKHRSLLNAFQLLLKSHQDAFSHFVKTLVITAGGIKTEKQWH